MDTLRQHGVVQTPSGSWVAQSKRVLLVNNWFIEPEGDTDDLKQSVKDWLTTNGIDYYFRGYTALGAAITFETDAGALHFRMFWDDLVPR